MEKFLGSGWLPARILEYACIDCNLALTHLGIQSEGRYYSLHENPKY